jgi:SsrA-binding protein
MYFNEHGKVKLQLALAKGKKLHDKRDTEKNAIGRVKKAGCWRTRVVMNQLI